MGVYGKCKHVAQSNVMGLDVIFDRILQFFLPPSER